MKKCPFLSLFSATVLLLAGCATDSSAPTANTAAAPAAKPAPKHEEKKPETLIPVAKINSIAQGMKAETVREILGKPSQVTPFKKDTITGEIWTYRVAYADTLDQVATSMKEVPGWDPINNRAISIQEPVYQLQRTRVYTTLELLIVDGRLIQRKGGRDVDRVFY